MDLFSGAGVLVRQTDAMNLNGRSNIFCAGLALAVLGPLACKSTLAVFPDAQSLVAAQHGWCAELARFEAPQDQAWGQLAACRKGTPTGSAPFVVQLTACYRQHHESEGENALDMGALVARCSDTVLGAAEPAGFNGSEPVRTRCARMKRCSQVPEEACLQALENLDPMQKVSLTSAYSLASQHAIAQCLEASACAPDEDAAQRACYDAPQKERVWFPSN